MTGTDIAQVITSTATLIGVAGSVWVSVRNGKKIQEVHESTNGTLTKLMEETRKASRSEGRAEEQQDVRERTAAALVTKYR